MKRLVLGVLLILLLMLGLGGLLRRSLAGAATKSAAQALPAITELTEDRRAVQRTLGTAATQATAGEVQLHSADILSGDPRHLAISRDEAGWMRRHGYPTAAEMASLDSLDTRRLRGTRDPQLATLQGMALMRRNELMPAMSVLDGAAALGSTFAYEEAAIAEYRLVRERFGPSIDSDDVLRARLEVPRILGDYKVDYLIERYLPNYPLRDRASIVQAHTTTFLRKLGEETQLRGISPRGPDPRPNSEAWQKLRAQAVADPGRTVQAFVLE